MSNEHSNSFSSAAETSIEGTAPENTNRREVILGGLAVITTVTTAAGGASEVTAQALPKPTKVFHVGFGQQPSLKSIQGWLDEILKRNNCVTCGLNGFDIRFGLISQLERQKGVEKLPGVEAPVIVRVGKP